MEIFLNKIAYNIVGFEGVFSGVVKLPYNGNTVLMRNA